MRVLIVVPAYNESVRLPRLLGEIKEYLGPAGSRDAGVDVSFILVDDGSRREEYEATEGLVRASGLGDLLRVIRQEHNRGKGAAIRAGFDIGLREQADYLGFMDADGAVSVREMHRALLLLVAGRGDGLAGVIGSRVKMLGRRVQRVALRHAVGRVFATFVTLYFGHGVYDSQCGLKIFEREALCRHLAVPDDHRWVWDTQLLLAMLEAGENIHELPIDWQEAGESKVSLVRDPLSMVWRLIRFRRRLRGRPAARGHGAV